MEAVSEMSSSGNSVTSQRKFERSLVRTEALVVEMRSSPGGRAVSGKSRNISLNGIFVETAEHVEVGAEVQLFIGSKNSWSALRAVAKVVHVVPGTGFGATFIDDSEEARECVSSFIKRFQKKS